MLSFKALSEKKTKITLNPKLKDVMEKSCDTEGKKKCSECDGEGCKHCGGTGYHSTKEKTPAQKSVEGKGGMSEAKKDDSYLETDFKKRQKNNEKARKEMEKIPGQKNPHFEAKVYDPMEDDTFDHDEAEATRGQSGKNKSITVKKKTKKTTKEDVAYVSQEEVSEESTKESETETFLTFGQFTEATRAAKEGKKDEHRVGVDIRAKQSATTLAAKRARQKVLDDYEKKTGKKLDISKSPEGKTHAKHFGGSRQAKKVKGKKETPAETHNRRVGKNVARIVKHGYTSKEKKEVKAMAKQTSRFD